jgi:2-C-methyl-D-erythritol 4-phosphate cytidylyltransferase
MAKFHVIIPAAGSGSRMQAGIPKQYLMLLSKPLISWCLNLFCSNLRITNVYLALDPNDQIWNESFFSHNKLNVLRTGGETRSQTVLNTLNAIAVEDDDWILVHDAARPGLSHELLNKMIDALGYDEVGGLLAIPAADTLKRSDLHQSVLKTEPREHLWQAQTPQMFRYGLLKKGLKKTIDSGLIATDESQAIEYLGLKPKLIEGELRNLKVTYPQDLLLAEAILAKDVAKNSERK